MITSDNPPTLGSESLHAMFAPMRDVVGQAPNTVPPLPPLEHGTTVGDYVIAALVGKGGMGEVYEAHDVKLGRKVALKVLSTATRAGDGSEATRLLREAQALARLSHPNVVIVYSAGNLEDGRVWIAMEFVAGMTLRAWGRQPRAWAEVLRVLKEVARGVAAVHRAGIVHRDLKPDNVMIDADARVRVMDFGLAQERLEVVNEDETIATEPSARAAGTLPQLTRSTPMGIVPGTPAYIAPERWQGSVSGPAADQFAWSVMAWELLYGARPFAGRTVEALTAALLSGPPAAPPASPVPAWLRKVIVRGLAVDPAVRHASMEQLMVRLDGDPTRRRVAMSFGALVIVLVVGWVVVQRLERERALAACSAAGATIGEIWNDEARARLQASLAATGASFALNTAERVIPWIDGYADSWMRAQVEACQHGTVEGTWTLELAAEAGQCLDERRQYLKTLLDTLSGANENSEGRGMARAAVPAVAALPAIDACLDKLRLAAQPRVPDDRRVEIQRIRMQLAKAAALEAAGQYKEGLTEAESAQRNADELGWTPLRAEAAQRRGALLLALGSHEEAERALEMGYLLAGEAGPDEVFTDVASTLAFVVGYHRARHTEGILWGKTAEMLLKRFSTPRDSIRWAQVLDNLGSAYQEDGKFEVAIDHFQRALAIAEEALGREHPGIIRYIRNLTLAHYENGAYKQAEELLVRALTIAQTTLGPEHPETANLINVEGNVFFAKGEKDNALRRYEQVLTIQEKSLGESHSEIAVILTNIGNIFFDKGETELATHYFERALKLRVQILGPNHPKVARSLTNLARVHIQKGEIDRAIELNVQSLRILENQLEPNHPDLLAPLNVLGIAYEKKGDLDRARDVHGRALGILRTRFGAEHPNVAAILANLAVIQYEQKDEAAAIASLRSALAIREKAAGAVSPDNLPALAYLGYIHAKAGRAVEARAVLERALVIMEREAIAPYERGDVHFALAIALWATPDERGHARELAETALAEFRESGPRGADEALEVARWLESHVIGQSKRSRNRGG